MLISMGDYSLISLELLEPQKLRKTALRFYAVPDWNQNRIEPQCCLEWELLELLEPTYFLELESLELLEPQKLLESEPLDPLEPQ